MFAFNPTPQVILLNAFIIVLLGVIGIYTGNPLVILGLLMLQPIPLVSPTQLAEEMTSAEGGEVEFPHDSGDHTMGFLADLKRKS